MRTVRLSEQRSVSDHVGPIEEYAPGRFRVRVKCDANETAKPEVKASPYRSKLEASFAQHLDALQHGGAIKAWRYEPMRLILAPKTSYCPDFLVEQADGSIVLIEVKGYWREDAKIKIKVAARMFPWWDFYVYSRPKGGDWREERVRA